MKVYWYILVAIGCLSADGSLRSEEPAALITQDHLRFERAMIFSGQGTDFTAYIGMYDAAVDAGRPPDLIIATSGGAIAGVIITSYPNRTERNEFLSSHRLHEMMLSIHIDRPQTGPLLPRWTNWKLRAIGIAPRPPQLFTKPLATKPNNFGIAEADFPFGLNPAAPRMILIAAECDFTSTHALRPGKKLFTETWFTDPVTALRLQGIGSSIGEKYPKSAVHANAKIVTDATVNEAMQASISEPYIFAPTRCQGRYYAGGVINLWPYELAQKLARETIVPKQGPFRQLIEDLIASVFEYAPKQRREEVDRLPVTWRVDMADSEEFTKDYSFWFHVKWVRNESEVQALPGGQPRPNKPYLIPRPHIVQSVPEDENEFHRCLNAQWQYGYDRTKAAFDAKNECPK